MSAVGQGAFASVFTGAAGDRRCVRTQALHRAAFGLALASPAYSARTVATRRQLSLAIIIALIICAIFVYRPAVTAQVMVAAMSLGFVLSLALRTALACFGRSNPTAPTPTAEADLPVYTVLLPLYREAGMVPQLADALGSLDYPRDRLDLKFIVEEDDRATRDALGKLGLEEIVVVPVGRPRTKPKACNYALQAARGEFVVIFDAEDRPEADQLRKAVAAFRADPGIACFQARLSIDNRSAGWLSRMFALDYGVWFYTLLPGLDRLHAPIPLGGTSNHFRTRVLLQAGGWDPFNVTEDADLGFRLARLGQRVSMLRSTTVEEAPARLKPWLRQRTRWMKGYMQTMLVHTRNPRLLLRDIGWSGSLMMQAFLGGAIWSALVNPLLWVIFALSCIGSAPAPDPLDQIAWTSGLTLLLANALLAALSLVDRGGRHSFGDLIVVLSYPIYWLLISLAAYRALWQLVRSPFRWEKTPHGAALE